MIKVPIFCNSSSNECYWEKVELDRKCKKSCFGLYADVWFDPPCKRDNFEDAEVLAQLEEEYFAYKTKFGGEKRTTGRRQDGSRIKTTRSRRGAGHLPFAQDSS